MSHAALIAAELVAPLVPPALYADGGALGDGERGYRLVGECPASHVIPFLWANRGQTKPR